jgi:hypothetical protein
MKSRMFLTIASAAFLALGVSHAASAQDRYAFKIPNSFVANGKAFAAGDYDLSVNLASEVITLQSKAAKGGAAMLPVETRVAERKPLAEPEVVFDKLNGQLYLSELLVPGEDGYVLYVNKAKHTHESLKGSRAKK